jgi:hypothetical protein
MKVRIPIACTAIAAFSFGLAPGGTSAAPTAGSGRAASPPRTTTAPPSRATQPSALGPSRTGQPNQSCGSPSAPNTPGNSAQAPGSAFNPDGKAGTVYAGEQPQNSRNSASVSQYDAACAHQR